MNTEEGKNRLEGDDQGLFNFSVASLFQTQRETVLTAVTYWCET